MNKGKIWIILLFLLVYPCIDVLSVPQKQEQLPGRFAGKGIVVGLEYVVFDKKGKAAINMADVFAETGMMNFSSDPFFFPFSLNPFIPEKEKKDRKVDFKCFLYYI